jgi:putative transcriptional regulator
MTHTTPVHHPTLPVLVAAARGEVSPAMSRILQAHASLCTRCRQAMNNVEVVAGVCLAADPGVETSSDALQNVLAVLDREENPTAAAKRAAPEWLSSLPKPVHDIIAPSVGAAGWRFAGPGLRTLDLTLPDSAERETFQLLRIEPGFGAPRHTHAGQELTLVLTGAFSDVIGTFRCGDLAITGPDVTHSPTALPGETCYALAVTTAPLKFKGALGVLQQILGQQQE